MTSANPSRRQAFQLARSALRQYPLRDITMRFVRDANNLIYRIWGRPFYARRVQQFVLRLHLSDWNSDSMIESEMLWLDALRRETDLLVPTPVRTVDENFVGVAMNKDGTIQRTCTMLEWIDGRVYRNRPSRQWLRLIGGLLAELQIHGKRFRRPTSFQRPRWTSDNMLGKKGPLKDSWQRIPRRAQSVFADVSDRFHAAAKEIGTSKEHFGLIHADLHPANAISHKGRIAAIDFDDCCDGYYLSDMAASLAFLDTQPKFPELRDAFLDGYHDVRNIPNDYVTHLDVFQAARWIMVCLYLAREPGDAHYLRRTLDRVLPRLRQTISARR